MQLSPQTRIFLTLTALFWISLLLFVLFVGKERSFLLLQFAHSETAVKVMQLLTFLADGSFVIIIVLLTAVFRSYRLAILLLGGFLLSGLVVQSLKNTIFSEEPRPVKWFRIQDLPLEVPYGLNPHENKSFPSGHSATAGAFMTFLAFRTRKTIFVLACFAGIVLLPYTRIYLFQHFPGDVAAGLLIGVLIQVLIEALLESKLTKLNRSLIRL